VAERKILGVAYTVPIETSLELIVVVVDIPRAIIFFRNQVNTPQTQQPALSLPEATNTQSRSIKVAVIVHDKRQKE
jgi:hypothetical protein